MTIPKNFFSSRNAGFSHRPALLTRSRGRDGRDVMCTLKRAELEERVRALALGLIDLGIGPGERVALLVENGPDWIVSDLAVLSAGAVTVPLYTTLPAAEVSFILRDSGAKALIFAEKYLEKALKACGGLEELKHLITLEESTASKTPGVLPLSDLLARGRDPEELNHRIGAIDVDDPFSIIYTSGTTGRPKGVVLSHGNLLSNIDSVLKVVDITEKDTYLSYLPLSHAFERMVHHLFISRCGTIAYSRGFAHVGADIAFFRPTLMIGVPFFFDRMKAKICEGLERGGRLKRFLFEKTLDESPPHLLRRFLRPIVSKEIKKRFGGRIRFFISGGAALTVETARFFSALGLPVIEGYGLTETSPVISVNTPEDNRIGTVGRPVPGVEVRISDDGEVLVKGPNVMKGYHNMPDRTKEVIKDGWLHTGDTGSVDSDGFLTISGRKKDLIVTSVGKNIPPQKIENLLKADEFIKEALVFGDGRPHLVCLIVPETERLEALTGGAAADPYGSQEVKKFFEERIRRRLKGLARYEQIRNFALIKDDLSVEEGELTPTMKVRRDRVAARYRDLIDGLYIQKEEPAAAEETCKRAG